MSWVSSTGNVLGGVGKRAREPGGTPMCLTEFDMLLYDNEGNGGPKSVPTPCQTLPRIESPQELRTLLVLVTWTCKLPALICHSFILRD